jgi:hypothetical protein
MKYDIEKLKEKNPLASVIQEVAGYQFLCDDPDGRYLRCVDVPDLRIDQESQRWYLGGDSGDVINWLRDRLAWQFLKAAEYLESRSKRSEPERVKLDILTEKPEEKSKPKKEPVFEETREWPPGHEGERGWSSSYPGAWTYKDPLGHIVDARIKKALVLLEGFPRGVIDDLVLFGASGRAGQGKLQYGLLAGIPTNFVQAMGHIYICGGCYEELDDFCEYYYPLLYENKKEFVEFDDIYCQDCVKKYMRWHKGRVLLSGYLADNYPDDRWLFCSV